MINEELKEACCGCGVCELICPRHAIEMQADDEGFLYPIINREKCVDCRLCEKKCAFRKKLKGYGQMEVLCRS